MEAVNVIVRGQLQNIRVQKLLDNI